MHETLLQRIRDRRGLALTAVIGFLVGGSGGGGSAQEVAGEPATSTPSARSGRTMERAAVSVATDWEGLLFLGPQATEHLSGRTTTLREEGAADQPQVLLALAYAPDGTTLATAGETGKVILRAVPSGAAKAVLAGHQDVVATLAFSHDGTRLAAAGSDRTIRVWDVATRTLAATLMGHQGTIRGLAFALNDRSLASAGFDKRLKLWVPGPPVLAPEHTFTGHEGQNWFGVFSPDGALIATGAKDRKIRLYDAATRHHLATLEGHESGVSNAVFTHDSKTLLSSGWDGVVKIWDVVGRREVGTLRGHARGIAFPALAPDGRTLATASEDSTVKLWDLIQQEGNPDNHRPDHAHQVRGLLARRHSPGRGARRHPHGRAGRGEGVGRGHRCGAGQPDWAPARGLGRGVLARRQVARLDQR